MSNHAIELNVSSGIHKITERQVTCVFARFLIVLNEVLDNRGGYHITYIFCIFMFERLKSYANTFTPVIKSWAT
jgi:hypothetical protein